jgi:hypothetical protein
MSFSSSYLYYVGLFLEYDLAGGEFVGSINDLQQILPLRYWIVTLVVTHIDRQRQPIALDARRGVEFARRVLYLLLQFGQALL